MNSKPSGSRVLNAGRSLAATPFGPKKRESRGGDRREAREAAPAPRDFWRLDDGRWRGSRVGGEVRPPPRGPELDAAVPTHLLKHRLVTSNTRSKARSY